MRALHRGLCRIRRRERNRSMRWNGRNSRLVSIRKCLLQLLSDRTTFKNSFGQDHARELAMQNRIIRARPARAESSRRHEFRKVDRSTFLAFLNHEPGHRIVRRFVKDSAVGRLCRAKSLASNYGLGFAALHLNPLHGGRNLRDALLSDGSCER